MNQAICAFDENDELLAWNQHFIEIFPYYEGMMTRRRPALEFTRRSAQENIYGPGDVEELAKTRLESLMSGIPSRGEIEVCILHRLHPQ